MGSLDDRYFSWLKQALFSADPEEALAASADLGRAFVRQEIPPEEVAELHHAALLRLAIECPDLTLRAVAGRLSATLMEALMAYSLAFRQQREHKAIATARRAQSSKLEAIGTLAAGVAHDFNTILGIISGYAELLSDQLAADPVGRQRVDHIVTASFRARDLIARMLAFARQQTLAPVPVEAVSVIRDALEMIRVTLPPGIKVSFEAGVECARLAGDPAQVQQVVMNLCTNGADAMNGQGELEISIQLVAAPENDPRQRERLCLVIADNGCGMPHEVQQRVFDPFYTTKEPGKGSGLGLSVVYGIVSDLQGEIQIHSEVGVGSRFAIYLPLAEPDQSGHRVDGPTEES